MAHSRKMLMQLPVSSSQNHCLKMNGSMVGMGSKSTVQCRFRSAEHPASVESTVLRRTLSTHKPVFGCRALTVVKKTNKFCHLVRLTTSSDRRQRPCPQRPRRRASPPYPPSPPPWKFKLPNEGTLPLTVTNRGALMIGVGHHNCYV